MTEKTTLTTVPLGACHLSPFNPRQSVTEAEIADLAASIRAVGLIQSLAGWERQPGRVEIVAGGRRLRALGLIAREDEIDPASCPVPVMLAADEAEARNWARSENIARAALHPADEIAAYRDMAAEGAEPERIAKVFAVTLRHVKGRLRLAGLAEPILAALREGAITLDVAMAYAIAPDPAQQAALFAELSGGYYAENSREIRRRLTSGMADLRDRLVRLVGREAYEAAGGEVREDLFGEDCFFADRELLTRLALDRLDAVRETLIAGGWAWVEAGIERPDYEALSRFGRTYPERVTLSAEDAARHDALAKAIEAGTASAEDEAEYDALAERFDEETFAPEQQAHGGVILWVSHDGEIAAERGLVRPEDRAAAEAAGICRASRHADGMSTEGREARGPYSAAMLTDLAVIRTGSVQAALLDHPDLALDLLTFMLSTPVLACDRVLGIATEVPANAVADDEGMGSRPSSWCKFPDGLRA